MDHIKGQIESILQYHEILWSKILNSEKIDHLEIAIAASDVRGKLNSALDAANTMFESNMQCLTHILTLQKDKATLVSKHEAEVTELNDRVASLLGIIASQQSQIESSSSLLRIKAIWGKVVEAYRCHNGDESSIEPSDTTLTNDGTTTALALLSAYFANEITQPDAEQGKSIIHSLLEKITVVESSVTADYRKHQEDNEMLRMKLQEKSAKLHNTNKQLKLSRLEEERLREDCERLYDFSRALQNRIDELEEMNKKQEHELREAETSLAQVRRNYDDLTKQYNEAITLAESWKSTCLKYEDILKSNDKRHSPELDNDGPTSPISLDHIEQASRNDDSSHFNNEYVHQLNRLSENLFNPKISTEPILDAVRKQQQSEILKNQQSSRYNKSYYSPSNSSNSFEYMNFNQSNNRIFDADMQLQPAVSFQCDSLDITKEGQSIFHSVEDSPNHERMPPTPQPYAIPNHPEKIELIHKGQSKRIVYATPSPMTDHSSFLTNPPTTDPRYIESNMTNTVKKPVKHAGSTPIATSKSHIKPQGYVSKATEKAIERRFNQGSVPENRYPQNDDERNMFQGDISMNSSMEHDVTEAIKRISEIMPWDD